MDGFLLIDKPTGLTSMDVIRRLRKVLGTRKLGHTGTLDPAATGLLPVTIGSCTKLAKFLTLEPKIYAFEVVFGTLTETADDEGAPVQTGRADVTLAELQAVLEPFIGAIEQRPPRYSAIKVDGRRAYELARAGVDFELPARTIQIDALTVEKVEEGVATMQVTCGTGTYVRSLAVDLAAALGTVAHARGIRRLRVGDWTIGEAVKLEDAQSTDVRSPVQMMSALQQFELTAAQVVDVRHGKAVGSCESSGSWALVREGALVAVAECADGKLHPRRVLGVD